MSVAICFEGVPANLIIGKNIKNIDRNAVMEIRFTLGRSFDRINETG